MNLPAGYAARPSRAADLDGILAVLHARDLLEVGRPDATAGWVEDAWRSPRVDVATDTRVVEAPDGTLVAYADVTHVDDPAFATAWAPVHPAHRGRGIGTALLGWIEGRAAALPARALHQHVEPVATAPAGTSSRTPGFRVVRTHLHMVRDLDDGRTTDARGRCARGDPSRCATATSVPSTTSCEVAFAEHFALTVEPFDVWWAEWSADPLFDPDLFLLAEDDAAGIVGVALDFVDARASGWVGDLGVLPAWRGRGIAKALLAASFDAFRARGSRRRG